MVSIAKCLWVMSKQSLSSAAVPKTIVSNESPRNTSNIYYSSDLSHGRTIFYGNNFWDHCTWEKFKDVLQIIKYSP